MSILTPVLIFVLQLSSVFGNLSRRCLHVVISKYVLIGCLIIHFWICLPAIARADNTSPADLFEIHCAGCHPNGANIIRRGKNLKQRALKRYGYTSVAPIAKLITNGQGLMSAYADRLSTDDITDLANYVLDQAAINWKPAK